MVYYLYTVNINWSRFVPMNPNVPEDGGRYEHTSTSSGELHLLEVPTWIADVVPVGCEVLSYSVQSNRHTEMVDKTGGQ